MKRILDNLQKHAFAMKSQFLTMLVFVVCLSSCNRNQEISSIDPVNWDKRTAEVLPDSLENGSTYLSVYSQIYSETEHKTHPLTSTISIRNTNRKDTIYIKTAEYFNTSGKSLRDYLKKPIYLAPMETVEIVIDQEDKEGGTGANFLFDWGIRANTNVPFFECVMISTYGQQGLSFTTQGLVLKKSN